MRVLHIAKEDITMISGGMGVHIRDACEQLAILGVECTVLCVSHDQNGVIIENYKGYRVIKCFNENEYCYNSNQSMIDDIVTDQVFYINLVKHLKNESFDLVHLHDSQLYNVARLAKTYFECPLVMTCHLSLFLSHPIDFSEKYSYLVKREGIAYHSCDKLMTVSRYYKKLLEDNYLLKNKDISVVWNGVNYEELKDVKIDEELRERLLNGKEKIIGFVGRMVNTKGIDLILDAVKAFPNYQFVVISTVLPTMEVILPIIQKVKNHEKIHDNLNWIRESPTELKWRIMKCADIAIMPSIHEPFGIVALEWMSLGIPLIVSNTEGLSDFCNEANSHPFHAGTLNNYRPKNLIDRISNFVIEEKRIINATQTAMKFSWKSVAKRYKEIYEEIS